MNSLSLMQSQEKSSEDPYLSKKRQEDQLYRDTLTVAKVSRVFTRRLMDEGKRDAIMQGLQKTVCSDQRALANLAHES